MVTVDGAHPVATLEGWRVQERKLDAYVGRSSNGLGRSATSEGAENERESAHTDPQKTNVVD
jgi:hypothetical protein